MKVLFTSWDNDLHVTIEDLDNVPRVDEYMRFNLPGEETKWMRVSYVSYEYFSIHPTGLGAHVYLEEIDGAPPFYSANAVLRRA